MKITDVEALYLRLPTIEARTDSSQDALIVKVSTDAGLTGWGEVDGCPAVVKAIIEAPMSHTLVTGLRTLLVGEDPLETGRLWDRMYRHTLYYGRAGAVVQAMAGIDLALWDIKGKALDQPVWALLGGKFRDRMRAQETTRKPLFRQPEPELAAGGSGTGRPGTVARIPTAPGAPAPCPGRRPGTDPQAAPH